MDPVTTPSIDALTREISTEQVQDILASTIRGVSERLNASWRLESSEKDLSIFRQKVPGRTDAFKIEAHLNANVDIAFESLCSYEIRKKWDEAVAQESNSNGHNFLTAMSKSGDHVIYRIVYTRTPHNLAGIIAARDFVDMTMTRIDAGGKITYFAKSVSHPDYPQVPGIVRGYNYPCGMTFVPEGPTSCRLTYLLHPDISGWIPSSVKNSSMNQALMNMMQNFVKFLDSKQAPLSLTESPAVGTPNRQKNPENKDELYGLYSSVLEGESDGMPSWGDLTSEFDKDKAFDLMWPENKPQFEVDFNFLGAGKSDDESSVSSHEIQDNFRSKASSTITSASGLKSRERKRKKGMVMPITEKRARNKKAADKYRKKKREEYETLISDCACMSKENGELKAKIEKLEGELSYLRDLLLTAVSSHVDHPAQQQKQGQKQKLSKT